MITHGYLLPTRGLVMRSDSPGDLTARTGEVVDLARRAEALGFAAVWAGDSVLTRHRLEPLTTLASVATATDAVELGTAVYLPHLRHPVHVAHATATLDQLSGGRLVLGVGVGTRHDSTVAESRNLGVPFAERGRALDECLDALRGLWRGEAVDADGIYRFEDAQLDLPPCRTPPIHIATTRLDPEIPASIRDRIGAHADGWLPQISPEEYAAGRPLVREAVADAGRDPDDLDAAVYVDAVIAPTEEEAFEVAREFIDAYYAWEIPDAGVRRAAALGPPEAIAERIEEYVEAGVERFVVRFPGENQREQMAKYAQAVGLRGCS